MRKLLAVMAVFALVATAPAWAQAFFEDFDSGAGFPPPGWALVDYLGTSAFQWTDVDHGGRGNLTGGTGLFAIGDSDWFSGDYDIAMITHSFVVPGGATLEFDSEYQNLAGLDWAEVDIDVGAGWVNLLAWNGDVPGPHHEVIDISAYAGQTAIVQFHYYDVRGGAWDWWWEVDNVQVTPEPGSLALLGLGALALIRRR